MPEQILKDVDWLAPLEDMTRDQLIGEAVKRVLQPHLEIRKQVSKAASKRGKTSGPFNTADEMIAHMKGELRKRQVKVLKGAAGARNDKDHPELKQGAADWIRQLRVRTPGWLKKFGDEAKRKA